MKEIIIEVQDYFTNKILNNEFEVVKIYNAVIEIKIDNEFNFALWIGNMDIPSSTKQYLSFYDNFMKIDFTDAQSRKLNKLLKPMIEEYKYTTLKAEKLAQIEKLQSEVEKL